MSCAVSSAGKRSVAARRAARERVFRMRPRVVREIVGMIAEEEGGTKQSQISESRPRAPGNLATHPAKLRARHALLGAERGPCGPRSLFSHFMLMQSVRAEARTLQAWLGLGECGACLSEFFGEDFVGVGEEFVLRDLACVYIGEEGLLGCVF